MWSDLDAEPIRSKYSNVRFLKSFWARYHPLLALHSICLYFILSVNVRGCGGGGQRHSIPPVAERQETTKWQEFIRTHMAVLVATDFFTTAVWS